MKKMSMQLSMFLFYCCCLMGSKYNSKMRDGKRFMKYCKCAVDIFVLEKVISTVVILLARCNSSNNSCMLTDAESKIFIIDLVWEKMDKRKKIAPTAEKDSARYKLCRCCVEKQAANICYEAFPFNCCATIELHDGAHWSEVDCDVFSPAKRWEDDS